MSATTPSTVRQESAQFRETADGGTHAPTLFGVRAPVDPAALLAQAQHHRWSVYDTIETQIAELLRARDPARAQDEPSRAAAVERHLDGRDPASYGTWVHYPWTRSLVHVLPRDEYRDLRLSRNRNKIIGAEQRHLSEARIGIVGLSVGFSIAQTLVLEGIGGQFHLADPDTLCLSNLNRVPAANRDLGVNKAVVAARRLYEIDPYLSIRVYAEGLTPENVVPFMVDGGSLHLVLEECDDLATKVRVRGEARARRIPVIMDTNDRGLIDIERFDLEPDRPLLHGLLGDIDPDAVASLTPSDRIDLLRRFLGRDAMSRRLAESIDQVGVTLVSLPQLGSGTTIGAGMAADVARRVLLSEILSSGRFYADTELLVCD